MEPEWVDDVVPGKELGAREVVASSERVARYMLAVGSNNPWYAEGSPLGCPVAPATLFALEPFDFTAYRLQDRPGPVNQALEWHCLNAVCVGERLLLKARVVDRFVRGRRERVVFEMLALNREDRIAVRAVATVSYPIPNPPPAEHSVTTATDQQPAGQALTPYARTLDLEMTRALFYQKENWHTDAAAARECGHEAVVIGGPHLLCLMSECLTRELGVVWLRDGHVTARFLRPTYVGDTVTVRPYVAPTGSQSVADGLMLVVRCENQRGELVAAADAYVRGAPGGRAPV